MTKKDKGVKPDIILKTYWNNNEQFADFFNAVLYGGREVIRAQELKERDTESSVVLQVDDEGNGFEAARDLFKVVMCSPSVEYVLLGIENQEVIHYAMPLRDLEYNTYSYHKQYERIKEKYPEKKGLAGAEFLSHMKKTDKFIPVITVVIYYGEEPWNGARSLHEMLDLPEELKPFVNDYKMNFVEAGNTDLVFHNKNNRDLFNLLKLVNDNNKQSRVKREEVNAYINKNHIDKTVANVIGSTSGLKIELNESEGESVMKTLFRDIKKEGEIEGEIRGKAKGIIEMGFEFGLSEEDILNKLEIKLNISKEAAQEYLDMYGKQLA